MNPKVSIIIPNYNHKPFLQQRLDSVFNQTFQDFEVILLDDASTDGSQEILKSYQNHQKVSHIIFNDKNSGSPFKQWNRGIDLAKGDFIWIAESDDFCEYDFLEEVIKPLIGDSNIVLSYVQSNSVDEQGNILGSWLNYTKDLDVSFFEKSFICKGNDFIGRYLIHKNVIPNVSGVLFRKDQALKVGNLDSNLKLRTTGDWCFYFKLILGKKLAFNKNHLNAFRKHKTSVISKQAQTKSRLEIINTLLLVRVFFDEYLNVTTVSLDNVKKINKDTANELMYEKAIVLLGKKKYLSGLYSLLKISHVVLRDSKLRNDFFKRILF